MGPKWTPYLLGCRWRDIYIQTDSFYAGVRNKDYALLLMDVQQLQHFRAAITDTNKHTLSSLYNSWETMA